LKEAQKIRTLVVRREFVSTDLFFVLILPLRGEEQALLVSEG
jgi:hypothetical protein